MKINQDQLSGAFQTGHKYLTQEGFNAAVHAEDLVVFKQLVAGIAAGRISLKFEVPKGETNDDGK